MNYISDSDIIKFGKSAELYLTKHESEIIQLKSDILQLKLIIHDIQSKQNNFSLQIKNLFQANKYIYDQIDNLTKLLYSYIYKS